jgi:hypothetical protein
MAKLKVEWRLRFQTVHLYKNMTGLKKRVSAKRRMMHAALDSEFLYVALFSE